MLIDFSDLMLLCVVFFFFFKQKTAYEMLRSLVGSEMCIRDRSCTVGAGDFYWGGRASTLFWVDPEEDLQVIFMTQLIPSSTFNFRGQLKNICLLYTSDAADE